jgi:hypothetical protein
VAVDRAIGLAARLDAVDRLDRWKQAREEIVGNFPKAFSHIGLVNAAWVISEAERKQQS